MNASGDIRILAYEIYLTGELSSNNGDIEIVQLNKPTNVIGGEGTGLTGEAIGPFAVSSTCGGACGMTLAQEELSSINAPNGSLSIFGKHIYLDGVSTVNQNMLLFAETGESNVTFSG